MTRDTQKFAFKCSAILRDGTWEDVYKDPVGAPFKLSKAGRLKLIRENGGFKTVDINMPGEDILQTVFEDGTLQVDQTFAEIRNRLGTF